MPEFIRWLFPLLSFFQVIILISAMLLLCVVLGRFILRIFRVYRYLSPHFAVNLPIYAAAGFLFSTFILNTIAIFFIGVISLIIFSIITASAVFVLGRLGDISLMFRKAKILFLKPKNQKLSLHSLTSGLIPLILTVLTICHFSKAIEIMGWPPIGDVMWAHGPFTSLLVYVGKIPLTLEPMSSQPAIYPMESHIVAANLADWFGLFPGEAVLLVSGLIIILIPLLTYSLTYMLTGNIYLSLLTYIATFMIHPNEGNWSRWLMGYFYGGAYSNLLGLLIILFSIVILSLEYTQRGKIKEQELYVGSATTLFLSFLVLLLVYPSFTIFVAIMLLFIISKHYVGITSFIQKKPILILPPIVYGILFIFISNSTVRIYSNEYLPQVLTSIETYSLFSVSLTFFFDNITSYVMWIALLISILLLFRKKYSLLGLFYFLVFCVIFYTVIPTAPSILQIILPQRAVMIPWIISWVILSLGVTEVTRIGRIKRYLKSYTA